MCSTPTKNIKITANSALLTTICIICSRNFKLHGIKTYTTLKNKDFKEAFFEVVQIQAEILPENLKVCRQCSAKISNIIKTKRKLKSEVDEISSRCMKLLGISQGHSIKRHRVNSSPSSPSTGPLETFTPSKSKPRKRLALENITSSQVSYLQINF